MSPFSHSFRPLRVAVIGSGPSGFFAAEELLQFAGHKAEVDMFDALPTPFGLVRGGVAPDHQKIKSVVKVYEKTAARPGFHFFGNVEFGRDLHMDDLRRHYDAAIFAVGARADRHMEIPGENLVGSVSATSFVGWYNAHPDYRDLQFDLSCDAVAVVGNGNVAMDVTRILAVDPAELERTDIADYALDALKKSGIRTIYLLGRRGPLQAAFTNPEIRELCELKGADLIVDPQELELDAESQKDQSVGRANVTAVNNVNILRQQALKPAGKQAKKVVVRFLVSPVEIFGEGGRVKALKIEKNALFRDKDGSLRPRGTKQFETLNVGMVLRSVGYMGVALPGLPYDERKGIIPNQKGRAIDTKTLHVLHGLYVVGWAKRGPSGVIGTNKPDSIETVHELLKDFSGRPLPEDPHKTEEAVIATLRGRGVQFVDYAAWQKLDRIELEKGRPRGKVREKFSRVSEMISALKEA